MTAFQCQQCGQQHPRGCRAHKGDGSPCGQIAAKGATVCRYHGGRAPQVQAAAARRLEEQRAEEAVRTLGLPLDISPTEALLEEVRWTAGHVQWLRAKVQELEDGALVWGTSRTETEGGAALVIGLDRGGVSDVTSAPSTKTVQTAGPSIWYDLYERERKHLVNVCAAALKAGVEERRVRLAEQQGDLVALVIRRILDDLHLTPEQAGRVSEIVPRHLRAIAGGAA